MKKNQFLSTSENLRVAVFAAYNAHGIIPNYVLIYLQKLASVCDKIIFIADNETSAEQKAKLSGLVEYMQFSTHGEYDFGSYKRGLAWLKQQPWFTDIKELVLCNDSCFSVGPIAPIFAQMSVDKCDFWGMTQNTDHQKHLQSFFLVFKQQVLQSNAFTNFFNSVQHEANSMDVVLKYEVALTKHLEDNGFISDAYIKDIYSPHQYPLTTLRRHMPLIKKKVFIDPNYSLESITSLLRQIKKISPQDYHDVVRYFNIHPLLMALIPLFVSVKLVSSRLGLGFVRFFFQCKHTHKGYLLIKICKIPVYHRKETM